MMPLPSEWMKISPSLFPSKLDLIGLMSSSRLCGAAAAAAAGAGAVGRKREFVVDEVAEAQIYSAGSAHDNDTLFGLCFIVRNHWERLHDVQV